MTSNESLSKRAAKLAEEVEKAGPDFKDAATNRTSDGQLTMTYVAPRK